LRKNSFRQRSKNEELRGTKACNILSLRQENLPEVWAQSTIEDVASVEDFGS
jgi:hypothetical protein